MHPPGLGVISLRLALTCIVLLSLSHPSVRATSVTKNSILTPQSDLSAEHHHNTELPLTFSNKRLDTVLRRIGALSGIRFELSPSLAANRISAVLTGNNWQQAVQTFVQGFDHLSVVDASGKLRKIWLLGKAETTQSGDVTARTQRELGRAFASRPGENHQEVELPLQLWRVSSGIQAPREYADLPGEAIQVDLDSLELLEVGQPLQLDIPQLDQPVYAVLGSTHEQLQGQVQVWSGPVDGSHSSASVTITKGQTTTYLTVATGTDIYEISVDNASGEGVVVNEADMTEGKNGDDIVLPPNPN